MQNKKYIKFAEKSTVEVLSLGRLDEGIKKGDRKAATYKKKNAAGEMMEYMVEWPNLTKKQIQDLRRSKAGTYNDTGRIPYTCLVDPHTLKRMHIFKGGVSAKAIMEEVKVASKTLVDEHGKGMKRKAVQKINGAIDAGSAMAKKGDWDGAIKAIDKAAPKPQDLPEAFQDKIRSAREAIVASARTRLDEIKNMDAKEAKKALSRFMSKARKTGLVDEAREHLKSLKTD